MTLKELKIGESAVIDTVAEQESSASISGYGADPGEKVTLVKFAPDGRPQ